MPADDTELTASAPVRVRAHTSVQECVCRFTSAAVCMHVHLSCWCTCRKGRKNVSECKNKEKKKKSNSPGSEKIKKRKKRFPSPNTRLCFSSNFIFFFLDICPYLIELYLIRGLNNQLLPLSCLIPTPRSFLWCFKSHQTAFPRKKKKV